MKTPDSSSSPFYRNMLRPNFYDSYCFRCNEIVYQVDRIGPLKDFTFFHSGCFKCAVCGTKLTLKTYYNNQHKQDDKEVYCNSHVPKIGPGHLDNSSVGIRSALNVPRSTNFVNEQIRGHPITKLSDLHEHRSHANGVSTNVSYASERTSPSNAPYSDHGQGAATAGYQYGRFDASALHIAHALKQTELQKSYNKHLDKPIDCFLDRDEQKNLEMKQRGEEDDLYRIFARQREEEERKIRDEIKNEWERELEKLASRFEREMQMKRKRDEQNVLTLRHQQERDNLEKNMTLRRDKKKESLTKKILENERAAAAALLEKHSHEMLQLINEKRKKFLRNESIYLAANNSFPGIGSGSGAAGGGNQSNHDDSGSCLSHGSYPSQAPAPEPPFIYKYQIYTDPVEFTAVDQVAISVAQENQKTFTDLVRQLVGRCESDVEKARTIFRWITFKNLNTMQFDESASNDTPLGLLRGIKHGTESYHLLFKRLCSYVGLHCVVVKGYSKSAGYQPGVKFGDSKFRNSWNAVYVAGAWRFVQCNWGARHLVNAKEAPKIGKDKSKLDVLRYEYDDHYFLTDPPEFIYEFFPIQPEWQLLKTPITLEEFEDLPFVRSLFFRYGLYFPDSNVRSVMYTDKTGASTVRIAMPSDMQGSLIFHYNLKFYDRDSDTFDGISLKRFVMQSVVSNIVSFRVHAPCSGFFSLDIYANTVTPKEYLTGEPMKFKSICKFKICCVDLQTVMVPLPDCAGGEWGPTKATRLFGLIPITHQDALIFASREIELQFRMSKQLTDFMGTLHRNNADEKKLSKYVAHSIADDICTFRISFPEDGQYGLDIYTREITSIDSYHEKNLLTHCCKYLINSSKRH